MENINYDIMSITQITENLLKKIKHNNVFNINNKLIIQ